MYKLTHPSLCWKAILSRSKLSFQEAVLHSKSAVNYQERGSKHNSPYVYTVQHLPTLLLTEFTSARNTERTSGVLRLYGLHFQSPACGSVGFTQHSWLQLRDCLKFISKLLSTFNQAGYQALSLSKENVLHSGGSCHAYKGKHIWGFRKGLNAKWKDSIHYFPTNMGSTPHKKKHHCVLGVSDRTVTKQLFHLLESILKRYILIDTPDYSYICLQKDFNTL